MIDVESAGLSDVGKKRKGNEDSLILDDQMKLYIVADGMGGHQAGEVASAMVVKTMQEYMNRVRNGLEQNDTANIDETLSESANWMISGIQLSNRMVHRASTEKPSLRGMGSTISAIYFTNNTLIASNVGDSPIYLIRKDKIEALSVPHTVYAEQLARNPGAAHRFGKEYSHMLTRAMGIEDSVRADVCEIQCFKNDVIVISSDGLSDKVEPDEILKIVARKKIDKACKDLVDLANERGGDDNITVIVLRVKSVQSPKKGVVGWLSSLFGRIF